MTKKEKDLARSEYKWESVQRDLALTTRLTMTETDVFGRAYMGHTGIHPYDLVEWTYHFFKGPQGEAYRVAELIRTAFEAGRRYQDESN